MIFAPFLEILMLFLEASDRVRDNNIIVKLNLNGIKDRNSKRPEVKSCSYWLNFDLSRYYSWVPKKHPPRFLSPPMLIWTTPPVYLLFQILFNSPMPKLTISIKTFQHQNFKQLYLKKTCRKRVKKDSWFSV